MSYQPLHNGNPHEWERADKCRCEDIGLCEACDVDVCDCNSDEHRGCDQLKYADAPENFEESA